MRLVRQMQDRCGLAVGLLAAAGVMTSSARAQTANWATAVNGNWNDASKWSGGVVPNNGGPNFFTVNVGLPGAYTVNVNISPTITNLTHDGAGSFMSLGLTNNLLVQGNYTLRNAEWTAQRDFGGTGSLVINGATLFQQATFRHTVLLRTNGSLTFNSNSGVGTGRDEICDTGVDHRGSSCLWTGTGDIVMGRAATFSLSSASTFTIQTNKTFGWNGMGAFGSVLNSGTILKTSAGTTFFDRVNVNNLAGSTFRVQAGTVRLNSLTNYSTASGGRLTGGRFRIDDGAALVIEDLSEVAQSIAVNQSDVTLSGATASFAALNSLATNDTAGTLTLRDGKQFTTAGSLNNLGTVNVGVAGDGGLSRLTVATGSTLQNFNAGTKRLAGGTFNVAGRLAFDGADIGLISSNVVLDGASASIVDENSLSAFKGSLTVEAAGKFGVKGQTFLTPDNLTVAGELTIGAGATVEVGAGKLMTNISGGTLTGGTYVLDGILKAGAAQTINLINGDVTLAGNAAGIRTAANADALAPLTGIGTAGALRIGAGVTFTTGGGGDFAVAATGRLDVAQGGTFTVASGDDLTNFAGGVFTDGVFNIKGTLRFQNAAVTTINNEITLSGGGSITDLAGNDAFQPLGVITGSGKLTVESQALVTSSNLTLDGKLTIRTTSPARSLGEVTVNGNLDQLGILELDGGVLNVAGQYFNSGSILGSGTINTGLFQHRGTYGPDGLASTLTIGPGLGGGAGDFLMGTGSVITLDLITATPGGYDTISIAGTMLFEGGLAGTLNVNAGVFAGNVGDVFTDVILTGNPSAFSFANMNLSLNGGLSLVAIYGANSISFQVVPVPASMGVLAMGGILATRRRRH